MVVHCIKSKMPTQTMRYLQKFTRGFRTNLHAEISFIWVFSNSFLSYSHLKYGNAWNADKKIVYTISLLTKKMHLEFRGKRTIIKIASRGPGVGIWFLLTELRSLRGLETFLEFFTLTCLRGNGGMVSLSAASIFDPYFLLISFYFLWHIGPINCVMTTSGVSNVREKGKL